MGKCGAIRNTTVILFLLLFSILPGKCSTIYVKTTGSDSNSGLSWDQAKLTVQAGLNAASSGDEVWVAAGTYVERITLKAGVALYGGFTGGEDALGERPSFPRSIPDPNETIMDGNQGGRVVTSPIGATSSTRIDGFTIRNGKEHYTNGGGGIYCYSSSPTISNNTIMGNSAFQGGGIYCDSSSPTISNNTITGNSGLENTHMGWGDGGGVCCSNSSSPSISNNTISENYAWGVGGGICCYSSSPTISNNVITGNSAFDIGYGGGIYCSSSSPTITNNTIAGNTSLSHGGGVCCSSSSPIIANNIVAFNTSGIYSSGGTPTLKNNDVYENPAYNYSGVLPGVGDISADPNLSEDNFHIQPDSPCVDTGTDAVVDPGWLDMDGGSRQVDIPNRGIPGVLVDIGADESDGCIWYNLTLSANPRHTKVGGTIAVTITVYDPVNKTNASSGERVDVSVDTGELVSLGPNWTRTSPTSGYGYTGADGNVVAEVTRGTQGIVTMSASIQTCLGTRGDSTIRLWFAVTIGQAKRNGPAEVYLAEKVVTYVFAQSHSFYVEEVTPIRNVGYVGIRVDLSGGVLPESGDRVSIVGTLDVLDSEAVVSNATIEEQAPGLDVRPVVTSNRNIGGQALGVQPKIPTPDPESCPAYGLNNVGMLVRVVGRVKASVTDDCRSRNWFTIDDGSEVKTSYVDVGHIVRVVDGLKVDESLPSYVHIGDMVPVTGISSVDAVDSDSDTHNDLFQRMIRIRDAWDVGFPLMVVCTLGAPPSTTIPHDTWDGKEITLQGTATAFGGRTLATYEWNPGDGTPAITGNVTDPYVIEARHVYHGAIGTRYTARLKVWDTNGGFGTDDFIVAIRDGSSLAVQANRAIDEGLWKLHKDAVRETLPDGAPYEQWTTYGVAGMACVEAFETKGSLPDGDVGEDPYVEDVRRGLNYLSSQLSSQTISQGPLCPQGNPDANGNGIGLYGGASMYEIGIALSGLANSQCPTLTAETGITLVKGRAYRDIAQDMVDYDCWAQTDPAYGNYRGGWRYAANSSSSDNTCSQWPVIGMMAAQTYMGSVAPQFTKNELSLWIDYIQNDWDGGSGYSDPGAANVCRTSGLLSETKLFGDTTAVARVQNACQYINTNWNADAKSNMYTVYSATKGLRAHGITYVYPPNDPSGLDWYADSSRGYAPYLVTSQGTDGTWPADSFTDHPLSSAWAVMVLRRTIF